MLKLYFLATVAMKYLPAIIDMFKPKRISHLLNLPTFIKNIISMLIKTLPPSSWNNILNFKIFPNQMGDKLYKINKLFSGNKDQFYRSLKDSLLG